MTKSDLIALLAAYPEDMEVKVACDHFVRPVTNVSEIVDIDTNIVSIEIIAEDKPGFDFQICHQIEESVTQERLDKLKADIVRQMERHMKMPVEIL